MGDFEGDPQDLETIVPNLSDKKKTEIFGSPRREMIHIKEDEFGVPQVTINNLGTNTLAVSDVEDEGVTDTEDFDVGESEALAMMGDRDDIKPYQLPADDTATVEASSKLLNAADKS